MNRVLCVDPSTSYSALVSRLAAESGLEAVLCGQAQEALQRLGDARPYALMIVANRLGDHDSGVDLVRATRLLANRVTMPIVFVMTDRDLELAQVAMQAGATEVVLRADSALLDALITEASNSPLAPIQTGRALLVEDNKSQAEYFRQLCGELGLAVDNCVSMEEGVTRLRLSRYHIAIIDIVLRGVNSGLALIRHIRQLPPPQSLLPILVISGFDDAARRIEALRLGADDFLSKPVAEEEFVWRLQRIIEARSASSPPGLASAVTGQTVWTELGLSARESEICGALVRGANDKQIAADLHISFWTVRTHIGKIFTKLGVINRRELMARYLPGVARGA